MSDRKVLFTLRQIQNLPLSGRSLRAGEKEKGRRGEVGRQSSMKEKGGRVDTSYLRKVPHHNSSALTDFSVGEFLTVIRHKNHSKAKPPYYIEGIRPIMAFGSVSLNIIALICSFRAFPFSKNQRIP